MYKKIAIVCFLQFFLVSASLAQSEDHKLIVGTKQSPPFSIKNFDGSWSGVSINLWKRIAQEFNWKYEFREYDLKGLLQALGNSTVDVAVVPLTITSQREKDFDFSQTYYVDSLGIAVPVKAKKNIWGVLRAFFTKNILKIIFGLAALMFLFGTMVWFFERKRNPSQFGGNSLQGIGSGFWWAAVTMTTVGYGDKAPITFGGRLVAIIWIVTAVILVALFTANITATLTVSQLESGINGPEDLRNFTVGTFSNSTSEDYLRARKINYQGYATLKEGLNALSNGELDSFVYDAAMMRYAINREYRSKIQVLPNTFQDQHYGLAFPAKSLLRESVNWALLQYITENEWRDCLISYLGDK